MDVLAFVAYGFGKKSWNDRYVAGRLIGINEPYAYGYHLAEEMGCKVNYSEDHRYNPLQMILRIALRVILGFDFFHAWRNRKLVYRADVIWTHTESQFLSLALVSVLAGKPLPKIIGQSVWLMDRLKGLSPLHRALYKQLAKKIDVLTFLSDVNAEACRKWLPGADVRVVRFGINCDTQFNREPPVPGENPKIVAVGNDRHRDWNALIDAFANTKFQVRIVSTKFKSGGALPANITVQGAANNDELKAAYNAADIAIVPLTENMHASGITAIFEAFLFARPVIATDVGGLRGYYPNGEVFLVDAKLKDGLRTVAEQIVRSPAEMTRAVNAGIACTARINSRTYVHDHVVISRELLGDEVPYLSLAK